MDLLKLTHSLKQIKLIIVDVDGTLTDGFMYYNPDGDYMKRFNVKDGMGLVLLRKAGYEIAIITSEDNEIVKARAKKLGIDKLIMGSHNKTESLKQLVEEMSITSKECAFIGDDVNDLHVMKEVGFSACPFNAVESIKQISDYISDHNGGSGAIREIAELILKTNNKPITLEENW